ncbi:MAG: DUF4291 domain-containing protein [Deltaproteobacteria bacterium]|nr:DUF4291 domain-containing protein [Deltaproteobacteria bacterium]
MLPFTTAPYREHAATWPAAGRHILAHHDADTIVVYQAYRPAIAEHAVRHQRFGGEFSLGRMSWIKPSFLWMMYRAGWATKPGQEHVLAIRLTRAGFDAILARAVHASYERDVYGDRTAWQAALVASDVRLQWDPDHDPSGAPQVRRAIQLGLSGATLREYVEDWCVSITDITPFVAAQRAHVNDRDALIVPVESVVPVRDPEVAGRLRLSAIA